MRNSKIKQASTGKPGSSTGTEKPAFLTEGIDIEEEEIEVYDLQHKFSESRANKSVPVYVSIIIFSLVLAGATIWFTRGIQRDIDRMRVGISEFRDINLQELLNALQRARGQLQNVEDKISMIRRGMDLEMEKIRYASELEIRRVEQSGLGQAAKKNLIDKIRSEENRKKNESRKLYEGRISEKEREAEAARVKMENYQKLVKTEKSEYDRQMTVKLSNYKKGAQSLSLKMEKEKTEIEKAHEKRIEEQRREYQTMLIAYEKEMKSLRDANLAESKRNEDTEDFLKLYRRALGYYTAKTGEHGFIIDPGGDGWILLDVNPSQTVRKGDKAYVLNPSSQIIAIVEIHPDKRVVRAKIIKRMSEEKIHPFDKILIRR